MHSFLPRSLEWPIASPATSNTSRGTVRYEIQEPSQRLGPTITAHHAAGHVYFQQEKDAHSMETRRFSLIVYKGLGIASRLRIWHAESFQNSGFLRIHITTPSFAGSKFHWAEPLHLFLSLFHLPPRLFLSLSEAAYTSSLINNRATLAAHTRCSYRLCSRHTSTLAANKRYC